MSRLRNGEISISSGRFLIHRNLTEKMFVSSVLYPEVIQEAHYENGYSNYLLKQQIGDDFFMLRIYFDPKGMIDMLFLSIHNQDGIPSWSDWSEEREMECKRENDRSINN